MKATNWFAVAMLFLLMSFCLICAGCYHEYGWTGALVAAGACCGVYGLLCLAANATEKDREDENGK